MTSGTRDTVAGAIVAELQATGVPRFHGLCGGHIQALWDEAAQRGMPIVDVRHENNAVLAAHAEAAVTGNLAVATVTAGPGFTNAMTALINAARSGEAVLVLTGRPPTPQMGLGAMQDVPQADMVKSMVSFADTIHSPRTALPLLRAAVAAAMGRTAPRGPAVLEVPTDVLRSLAAVSDGPADESPSSGELLPAPDRLAEAAELLRDARRPLIIGGRAVRESPMEVRALVEKTGALYLDSADSRGAVRPLPDRAAMAVRGKAMAGADVIVTLGRRLDFQLGYGSGAVFDSSARFLRVGRTAAEIIEGRKADVEVFGDVGPAVRKLNSLDVEPTAPDDTWLKEMASSSAERAVRLQERMASEPPGSDGRMHPHRLIAALNEWLDDDAAVVADGGDILSFARVGLKQTQTYLDCGPFGTLGVGVPYANGIASAQPGRQVVAIVGDGSLGFSAIELDTAARHQLPVVVVVANNDGWNIERHDQLENYEGRLIGVELPDCRYDQLAQSLGIHGERVTEAGELAGALERARDNSPALIDVAVSREPQSADFKSGLAGVPSWQALGPWDDAERSRQSAPKG